MNSAQAASDVNNTPQLANHATGSVAAVIASSQASTIVSTAATGGFNAGTGGFGAGGFGGFSSGGTGGFSPGGTGGTGGFSPGGTGGTGGFSPGPGNNPTEIKPQAMDFRLNGQSGGDPASQFGVWGQALWANVDKSEQALQMSGNVYNIMGGIDRHIGDRFLAGLAFGYENVDFDTKFNQGKYKDNGEILSPYLAVTLNRNWIVDISGTYAWLNYHTERDNGAVSASYSGHRLGASGGLTGNFAYGNWHFQSKTNVFYSSESQNSFVDTSLAAVDANSFALGRLSTGGKIGYATGAVMPYVKVIGEWDFKTPDAVLKGNGQMSEVDHGGAVTGVGIEANTGKLNGSLEVDYSSLGRQNLDVWAMIARFHWDF